MTSALETPALLRLLQLVSPMLPVGAYAYSRGLEQAVELGWVHDAETANDWISGLLTHSLSALDVPLLLRLHAAFEAGDMPAVRRWSDHALASRESGEMQAEERVLGGSLARLLAGLDFDGARAWVEDPRVTFLAMFALAAARWNIPATTAATGYLFAWCEAQVSAATRLIPLGQTQCQRVLSALSTAIPDAVERGALASDEDIGAVAPAQAIASALHESQYTRLFRS